MKKLSTILVSVVLGAVLMTGCSAKQAGTSAEPEQMSTEQGQTSAEPEQTSVETEQTSAEPMTVNVAALKGPTAMGMVDFMDKADSGSLTDNNYHFEIVAAVDEVTPKLVQGQVDIAAVPANLASVLYNNTEGGVEVLAVNTLGVIYIVESGDTVSAISDLKGKTIYASGKGATPEYALNRSEEHTSELQSQR